MDTGNQSCTIQDWLFLVANTLTGLTNINTGLTIVMTYKNTGLASLTTIANGSITSLLRIYLPWRRLLHVIVAPEKEDDVKILFQKALTMDCS